MKRDWDLMHASEQSTYLQKARYLIDGGYALVSNEEQLAKQIYMREKVVDKTPKSV